MALVKCDDKYGKELMCPNIYSPYDITWKDDFCLVFENETNGMFFDLILFEIFFLFSFQGYMEIQNC